VISFVWTPGQSFRDSAGGYEVSIIDYVRELALQGVAAQVVTVERGTSDGRSQFLGTPFQALRNVAEVSKLEGTVVFLSEFPSVRTLNPAYQFLDGAPPVGERDRLRLASQLRDRSLVATSDLVARLWSTFLEVDLDTIQIGYPFAQQLEESS